MREQKWLHDVTLFRRIQGNYIRQGGVLRISQLDYRNFWVTWGQHFFDQTRKLSVPTTSSVKVDVDKARVGIVNESFSLVVPPQAQAPLESLICMFAWFCWFLFQNERCNQTDESPGALVHRCVRTCRQWQDNHHWTPPLWAWWYSWAKPWRVETRCGTPWEIILRVYLLHG